VLWSLGALVALGIVGGAVRRCTRRPADEVPDAPLVDLAPPPPPIGTSSSFRAREKTPAREPGTRPPTPPSPPLIARLSPLPGAPSPVDVVEMAWTSRMLLASVPGADGSRLLGWTTPWSEPIELWQGPGILSRLRAPPEGRHVAVMLTTAVESALLLVDTTARTVLFTVRDPREGSGDAEPVWSPDGLHVALATPRGVFIVAPDTGARTRVEAPVGSRPARWDTRGLLFRKPLDFGPGEYHRWRMGERGLRSAGGAEDFRETPDGRTRLRHALGALEIVAGDDVRRVPNPRELSFWSADAPARWLGRRGAIAEADLVWLLDLASARLMPLAVPRARAGGLSVRAIRPDGRVCAFEDSGSLVWGEVTR